MVLARLVQRLTTLQVTEVLYFIGQKGRQVIHEVYPPLSTAETASQGRENLSNPGMPDLPVTQTVTHTGRPMVIAAYDVLALVSLARQAGAVIAMPYAVGDTLLEGEPLLSVSGGHLMLPQASLRRAVELKRERTFDQDPKYALRLLVDIAIKALSPAINDPTTAVQALDHIEDLLRRIGGRHLEVGQVRDEHGVLRVIFPTPPWKDFLMLAFDEIRVYGATSLQVMRRLGTALYDLAHAAPAARREEIHRYVEHLHTTIKTSITDLEDQSEALQQDRQGLGLSRQRPLG
jgi:uncharacterized membrane protein